MAGRRPPLILLPPSETKRAPRRGRPLDLASLSFPSLTPLREALLDDGLRLAPTAPAGRLYTGVLYAALDVPTLPPGAARNVVVVSAQFGALRLVDRVPAYRRELDAAHWRDGLRDPLDEATAGRVILDCRSSTYAAAWRPTGPSAALRVHVGVVEERDGVRRVVSHFAKRTRGEVARHLLVADARPRTAQELAAAVAECFECELAPPARAGDPYELTVVERRSGFVPDTFVPPRGLVADGLRLEPLGPEHNERDHAAWMSSIDHIHRTPGWPDPGGNPWPVPLTLRRNLADIEMHVRHFRVREGFTYTVLDTDGSDVVGCVYIYPGRVRSWVRASHAALDTPLRHAVSAWLASDAWPIGPIEYASHR